MSASVSEGWEAVLVAGGFGGRPSEGDLGSVCGSAMLNALHLPIHLRCPRACTCGRYVLHGARGAAIQCFRGKRQQRFCC